MQTLLPTHPPTHPTLCVVCRAPSPVLLFASPWASPLPSMRSARCRSPLLRQRSALIRDPLIFGDTRRCSRQDQSATPVRSLSVPRFCSCRSGPSHSSRCPFSQTIGFAKIVFAAHASDQHLYSASKSTLSRRKSSYCSCPPSGVLLKI